MKIAVIGREKSDLEEILSKYCTVTHIKPESKTPLDDFDACAILGGVEKEPLLLPIDIRLEVEKFMASNKPLFAEWTHSVGYAYLDCGCKRETISERMVFTGSDTDDLEYGALLDDRANTFYPFCGVNGNMKPVLCLGGHIIAHSKAEGFVPNPSTFAMFYYDENTLLCSFSLCNYVKARFAPQKRWDAIASIIVSFLTGNSIKVKTKPVAMMNNASDSASNCFKKGLKWIDDAEILIDNGQGGVLEGLSHKILPDGTQAYSNSVRNDCSGEIGGAFFFDYLNNKNEASFIRFKHLQEFCFEKMYRNNGIHKGMMRWTTSAWEVCYQDDVARAVLGTLLSMLLTDNRQYLDKVKGAMDYLIATTGTDGLRVGRTDSQLVSPEVIKALSSTPSSFACAHYNGYYMAVLLMTYMVTKERKYLDAGVKGIDSLMAIFPNTIREHSETQELCRLILPLACLYMITKDEKHRNYLYTVAQRLEGHRHEKGGYLEYDTGYKAARSRTSGTESSLLADNGDPVQDMLYSVNWLPLGFAFAYKATGDEVFIERWRSIVGFFSEIQTVSENKHINGSWCRAIDCELREAYGMPHDVGWGPCAVESGWTVGEILMGIGYGIAIGIDNQN